MSRFMKNGENSTQSNFLCKIKSYLKSGDGEIHILTFINIRAMYDRYTLC